MQNVFLDQRTIRDIDARVAKILRDIGDPEPPLRLEIVRDLLELDRAYYSSQNDGMLRETVHRMRLAGKQVLRRPSLLLHMAWMAADESKAWRGQRFHRPPQRRSHGIAEALAKGFDSLEGDRLAQ